MIEMTLAGSFKNKLKVQGKLNSNCYVVESSIHGKGVFAQGKLIKRKKIGSLSGIIIPISELPKVFSNRMSIALVELTDKWVLDSRKFKNELCFINHSCSPNCFMRIFGNLAEIYALKNIRKDEELTLDYFETHHEGKLSCKCGSKNCRGWL